MAAAASGCAPPVKPDGADEARRSLAALRADPVLAEKVQAALVDADSAVLLAEVPTNDLPAGQHLVYVATRKVQIARADAERKVAEQALAELEQERAVILDEAQRNELEIAKAQLEAAAAAALAQQQAALASQAEAAQARAVSGALREQLDALQAKTTDRGIVMTLGDVLFATGKSELLPGAAERLDQLGAFMHAYGDRSLLIEGHTDGQGSELDNQLLSQRRAEAVKAYLISQSVDAARITAFGRGMESPVADNATPEGRQQNRRVEIIISGVH